MSDTPRTDAHYRLYPIDEYEQGRIDPDTGSEWLAFARTLERENAELRRQVEELKLWISKAELNFRAYEPERIRNEPL